MKKLLFLLLFLPFLGNSQATFTAPVGYNTGAPTATPSGVGTRWRFDLLTGKKYTWLPGSLSWDEDARGIDQVAGCSAPLYTPGYNQSTFAVNACSPPVLYQWTGAAWEIPNEPEIYTAGTGISIDGSNVITNTAPNIVQTLSIAGQDLTLSNGGGTVAIPGVSWPLLAPNGDDMSPSYSFENQTSTGVYLGSRELVMSAAANKALLLRTADQTTEPGQSVNILAGSSEDSDGGGFNLTAGSSITGPGGGFVLTAGPGATGGIVQITSGAGTSGVGGNVDIIAAPGADPSQNGRINMFGNGVTLPTVTTAQRDAFSVVEPGMTIYNTDATASDSSTGVMQVYNGSVWKNAW